MSDACLVRSVVGVDVVSVIGGFFVCVEMWVSKVMCIIHKFVITGEGGWYVCTLGTVRGWGAGGRLGVISTYLYAASRGVSFVCICGDNGKGVCHGSVVELLVRVSDIS